METTIVDGLRTVKFDLVLTLALAALFLFVGGFVQPRVGVFARASIPAAAIGGLLFAFAALALRARGTLGVTVDTSLRAPLQTAFFTTIGLSATLSLLREGGWRTAFFWLVATLTAVVQNVVGILLAVALGAPALLGIICGALTLTGGPSTGLGWAAKFEEYGVAGAGAPIITSAIFGIFVACLVGNPVATWLIRRRRLADARADAHQKDAAEEEFWALSPTVAAEEERETEGQDESAGGRSETAARERLTGPLLLHNLLLILALMGAGAILSKWISLSGVVLPDYIGALVLAAIARNVDDRTGWLKLNARAVEALGGVALALFLVIALMSLELWRLAGLALPMLVILSAQVFVMVVYAVLVTFPLSGRDYEAAVTASGHIGFGLGITANAVANMEALTARYRPAPRSFLVVPVVGGFFIDLSNSLVITAFFNLVIKYLK
ncbi:MAG TPA: sodium/glutamate symporter [Pyrinomonadaceae bacterium]|nr:sodium/glutamate symporter [Pyrinomonadaceae bacterium]